MKLIYVFIFSCFLLSGASQDLKIGFLDKDAVIREMKEIHHFEILHKSILRQNSRILKKASDFYDKEYKKFIKSFDQICYSSLHIKMIEKEFLRCEKNIIKIEQDINDLDSLFRKEVANYINNQLKETIQEFIIEFDFNMVINTEIILYAKDSMDITNDLVTKIEKKQNGKIKTSWFLKKC